jgi:transposase
LVFIYRFYHFLCGMIKKRVQKTKYLLLKDKINLTDEQYVKFESIRKANYEVSRAWQVKENFRDILFTKFSHQ